MNYKKIIDQELTKEIKDIDIYSLAQTILSKEQFSKDLSKSETLRSLINRDELSFERNDAINYLIDNYSNQFRMNIKAEEFLFSKEHPVLDCRDSVSFNYLLSFNDEFKLIMSKNITDPFNKRVQAGIFDYSCEHLSIQRNLVNPFMIKKIDNYKSVREIFPGIDTFDILQIFQSYEFNHDKKLTLIKEQLNGSSINDFEQEFTEEFFKSKTISPEFFELIKLKSDKDTSRSEKCFEILKNSNETYLPELYQLYQQLDKTLKQSLNHQKNKYSI